MRELDAQDLVAHEKQVAVGELHRGVDAGVGAVSGLEVFEQHVADALRSRTLVPTLSTFEPEPRTVSALYLRNRSQVPKIAVFLDFVSALFDEAKVRRRSVK